MDNKNRNDIAAKPQAGASDPKGKQAQLDKHPRKGRERVPSTHEIDGCGTENKTSQDKVRIQQHGKNYREHKLTTPTAPGGAAEHTRVGLNPAP